MEKLPDRYIPMIQIDNKIVSVEVLTTYFCCDLPCCKGICCVEGNAGAPLETEDVDTIEAEYENFKRYMKPEGVAAVEQQGFMVIDEEGDYTTPLIGEKECAYSFEENGITFCAIEKAHNEGKTVFVKPISCHLYPIRIVSFNNGSIGLNYHHWSICHDALTLGRKRGVPMYQMLRAPLIRRFGEEFFDALCAAEHLINEQRQ